MANEKRLISVDEWDTFFNEHIYNRCFRNEYEQGYTDAFDRVDDWMDEHPVVDAVEVVHAQWLYDGGSGCYFCSACDEYAIVQLCRDWDGTEYYEESLTNYCPNCGADMRGNEDDNDT